MPDGVLGLLEESLRFRVFRWANLLICNDRIVGCRLEDICGNFLELKFQIRAHRGIARPGLSGWGIGLDGPEGGELKLERSVSRLKAEITGDDGVVLVKALVQRSPAGG